MTDDTKRCTDVKSWLETVDTLVQSKAIDSKGDVHTLKYEEKQGWRVNSDKPLGDAAFLKWAQDTLWFILTPARRATDPDDGSWVPMLAFPHHVTVHRVAKDCPLLAIGHDWLIDALACSRLEPDAWVKTFAGMRKTSDTRVEARSLSVSWHKPGAIEVGSETNEAWMADFYSRDADAWWCTTMRYSKDDGKAAVDRLQDMGKAAQALATVGAETELALLHFKGAITTHVLHRRPGFALPFLIPDTKKPAWDVKAKTTWDEVLQKHALRVEAALDHKDANPPPSEVQMYAMTLNWAGATLPCRVIRDTRDGSVDLHVLDLPMMRASYWIHWGNTYSNVLSLRFKPKKGQFLLAAWTAVRSARVWFGAGASKAIMELSLQVARCVGCTRGQAKDESQIELKGDLNGSEATTSLRVMSLLTVGKGWYEQFGWEYRTDDSLDMSRKILMALLKALRTEEHKALAGAFMRALAHGPLKPDAEDEEDQVADKKKLLAWIDKSLRVADEDEEEDDDSYDIAKWMAKVLLETLAQHLVQESKDADSAAVFKLLVTTAAKTRADDPTSNHGLALVRAFEETTAKTLDGMTGVYPPLIQRLRARLGSGTARDLARELLSRRPGGIRLYESVMEDLARASPDIRYALDKVRDNDQMVIVLM